MKAFLKMIIPSIILEFRNNYYIKKQNRKFFNYDILMFEKYSGLFGYSSEEHFQSRIILLYHVIEKGLTMPDMKIGFGKPRIKELIYLCSAFKDKFGVENFHFKHALGVLGDYFSLNNKICDIEFTLLKEKFCELKKTGIYHPVEQFEQTKEKYFSSSNKDFYTFAHGRKSVRNYAKGINIDDIYKAIELAQTAPSTCNRQPSRVHVVKNQTLQSKILHIQKGNRGFGHLVETTLIITADLSTYNTSEERFTAFVDGGIFTMNMLYALHYYRIAACPLNWSKSPQEDQMLRKVVSIPPNETVIVIISCGSVPDDFKIANSPRTPLSNIITIHE